MPQDLYGFPGLPPVPPVVLDRLLADVSLVNSVAETTLWSYVLPANALPLRGKLRLMFYFALRSDDANFAATCTIRWKIGATTIDAQIHSFGDGVGVGITSGTGFCVLELVAGSSAGAQVGGHLVPHLPWAGTGARAMTLNAAGVPVGLAPLAVRTDQDEPLLLTAQHSVASANVSIALSSLLLEKL